MCVEKFLPDEEATYRMGQQIAHALAEQTAAHIYLHGQLGAGKTCLVRGFLRALGYQGKVKSPTYSLIEPYPIAGQHVYHFDFYRINDPGELEVIGISEHFSENAICLVEWPELAAEILPVPDLYISLDLMKEGRHIKIEAKNDRGNVWLQRLIQVI